MPPPSRLQLTALVSLDAIISAFCLWTAISLRLGEAQGVLKHAFFLIASPLVWVLLASRMNLYGLGLYFASSDILLQTLRVAIVHCLILAGYSALAHPGDLPRGVLMINLPILACSIAISRMVLRGHIQNLTSSIPPTRALIYGAGEAGLQLAAGLQHTKTTRVIGFVDDNRSVWGRKSLGLRIYPPHKIAALIDSHQVTEVLLAMPSAGRARLGVVAQSLSALKVTVKTLPGLEAIVKGKVAIEDVHDIQIEDILGRDPVTPDPGLLEAPVIGRSVLVTGAGGSIGSALCREIARHLPNRLVLLDSSEFALYAIDSELGRHSPELTRKSILGSVTNAALLKKVIREEAIEVVLHAAAYKHVPLVESNPCEGLFNNVIGTWRTAVTAAEAGVELFVLISTDKAVRPTNVMGASKRLAEMVTQSVQALHSKTTFCMVRFGNVLGSSGSVVPLFKEQIARGGPITVTHPEVTRYFMTIPEAAQLVLQASAMAKGGDVFLLDMGEPVKVVDLASRMIELSRRKVKNDSNPDGDIELKFTGLRPGEKLYEELLIEGDAEKTQHPRIMRTRDRLPDPVHLRKALMDMEKLRESSDEEALLSLLEKLVPEYRRDFRD